MSAPYSLRVLLCPNLSIHSCYLGSEYLLHFAFLLCPNLSVHFMLSRKWVPLAHIDSFYVLTCPSVCALQEVSTPCLLRFLLCPNMSVCLHSSLWVPLACSDSFFCPNLSLNLSLWVPFTHLDSFYVLTCSFIYCLQEVSASHLSKFLSCPNLSICLCSSVCKCPLLSSHFFSVLRCLSICALQFVSAPYCLHFFFILTYPSI